MPARSCYKAPCPGPVLPGLHHLVDPHPQAVRYLQGSCGVLQCCSSSLGFACAVELDFAQCRFDGLRLAQAVELEVDHDLARIVCGAHDTVAPDARTLPGDRIIVEGSLPGVVLSYRVFDAQDVHHLLDPSCEQLSCVHRTRFAPSPRPGWA